MLGISRYDTFKAVYVIFHYFDSLVQDGSNIYAMHWSNCSHRFIGKDTIE